MEETGIKLRTQNLGLVFGGLEALIGLDVEVREGEILAIIGPNGARNTCLLDCIDGFFLNCPQKGDTF